MKVVCINNDIHDKMNHVIGLSYSSIYGYESTDVILTIDKVYDVIFESHINLTNHTISYHLNNDNDILSIYSSRRFEPLEEIREKRINLILNESSLY